MKLPQFARARLDATEAGSPNSRPPRRGGRDQDKKRKTATDLSVAVSTITNWGRSASARLGSISNVSVPHTEGEWLFYLFG